MVLCGVPWDPMEGFDAKKRDQKFSRYYTFKNNADIPNVPVFPGDFEFSGIVLVCNQLPLGRVKYIPYRSFL
jgi:hypothetical protein